MPLYWRNLIEDYNKFYVSKICFLVVLIAGSDLDTEQSLGRKPFGLMGWKASSSCPFGTYVLLCGTEALLHIASSAGFLRTEGTCQSLSLALLIRSEGHLSSFHLFERSQVEEATRVSEVVWTDLENRRSARHSILEIWGMMGRH